MKTHYAECDRGNESNPHDEWFETLCGLEYTESPVSDDIKVVDCKKCIKAHPRYLESLKDAIKYESTMKQSNHKSPFGPF